MFYPLNYGDKGAAILPARDRPSKREMAGGPQEAWSLLFLLSRHLSHPAQARRKGKKMAAS